MKTKSLKTRFGAMALAVAMVLTAFPMTAMAVENPVNAKFSGEIPSMQEKVNYPWAIPGDEGNAPLNVTMNYVTDNSTLTLSKKPGYQGELDWYAYLYFVDDNNRIVDYTGCLTGGTLGAGQTTVKISPEKFMGTDYAGNLRDCVYQIQVEFMEGNTPYNVTYSYRIYDAGNPDMARADRFPLDTTVNGKEVTFESFTINGESYVAIRDFAAALNGTDKQFAVGYDAGKKAVTLTTGKAYTMVGTELQADKERLRRMAETEKAYVETGIYTDINTPLFDYDTVNAVGSTSKMYLNGKEVSLKAYSIAGKNYFKAKDLAQLLNIGYAVDSTTGKVAFDTAKGFTA